jgi:hypothetical protein
MQDSTPPKHLADLRDVVYDAIADGRSTIRITPPHFADDGRAGFAVNFKIGLDPDVWSEQIRCQDCAKWMPTHCHVWSGS